MVDHSLLSYLRDWGGQSASVALAVELAKISAATQRQNWQPWRWTRQGISPGVASSIARCKHEKSRNPVSRRTKESTASAHSSVELVQCQQQVINRLTLGKLLRIVTSPNLLYLNCGTLTLIFTHKIVKVSWCFGMTKTLSTNLRGFCGISPRRAEGNPWEVRRQIGAGPHLYTRYDSTLKAFWWHADSLSNSDHHWPPSIPSKFQMIPNALFF